MPPRFGFMSSAIAGEPFKFSTVSLESLKTIVGSLNKTSAGHNDFFFSILKEFFNFLQDSIFGPLLLLIFINDLCNTSQFLKFCMYADDTSLLFSSKKHLRTQWSSKY